MRIDPWDSINIYSVMMILTKRSLSNWSDFISCVSFLLFNDVSFVSLLTLFSSFSAGKPVFIDEKSREEEGESPAVEVFQYKDPNGYFASKLNIVQLYWFLV